MIRILIADDQIQIRRGLRMRLELEPDLTVVGEAADGHAAVAMAELLSADVVLMDVEMPGMDGITATAELRTSLPRCAVVMLSLYDDPATQARASDAGATAFVSKCRMDETLLDAIRGAASAQSVAG